MTNKKEWKFSMDEFLEKIARKQNLIHIKKEDVQAVEKQKKLDEIQVKKDQ